MTTNDELHEQFIVLSQKERVAYILSGLLANADDRGFFEDEDFVEEKNGPYIKFENKYWVGKGAYVGTHKLVTTYEERLVRYAKKLEALI